MHIKYSFVVLAFCQVLVLAGGQIQRSISSQVRDAIEAFRERMPCGFPEYGLPPLAPYKTEHSSFAIDNDILQAYCEVNHFRLYGLNNFDILALRVQALLSRATFKFKWNEVYFTTTYNASSTRGEMASSRSGSAKFSLKNITVWGTIKYNVGLMSGKLSVKELSVYVSLGEVKSEIEGLSRIKIVNKKLNRIIEKWFMLAVNDNTNNVALFTNAILKPLVNNFLSDKTISDLLAMVGSGEGTEEKEPCIPPEEQDYYFSFDNEIAKKVFNKFFLSNNKLSQ